jgi:hypothetical protein
MQATFAPALIKARPISAPIPLDPPVIIAVLFFNEKTLSR